MWYEVERLLESLISRYGLLRVLLAPYSLALPLSGLGLLQDRAQAIAFGTTSLFVASVLIIIALVRSIKVLQRRNSERQDIINDYVDLVLSTRSRPFTWELWEEYQTIGRGGDVVIEQYLTLRVVKKTPLHVAWIAVYQSSDSPLSPKQRKKITASARKFAPDGVGGRRIGANYRSTQRWEDNRLRVMIHLDTPLRYGDIARIHMRWTWPGFYRSLLNGGRDAAEWATDREKITHLVASLTFKDECRLRRGLEITPFPQTPDPRYHATQEGAIQIDLEDKDISAAVRKIGLGLDARQNLKG
jgi:hypothetical protein